MNSEVIRGSLKRKHPVVTITCDTRVAHLIRSAVLRAIKKCRKEYDPTFVPAPGKHDANLMRIEVLGAVVKQIDSQLDSVLHAESTSLKE